MTLKAKKWKFQQKVTINTNGRQSIAPYSQSKTDQLLCKTFFRQIIASSRKIVKSVTWDTLYVVSFLSDQPVVVVIVSLVAFSVIKCAKEEKEGMSVGGRREATLPRGVSLFKKGESRFVLWESIDRVVKKSLFELWPGIVVVSLCLFPRLIICCSITSDVL